MPFTLIYRASLDIYHHDGYCLMPSRRALGHFAKMRSSGLLRARRAGGLRRRHAGIGFMAPRCRCPALPSRRRAIFAKLAERAACPHVHCHVRRSRAIQTSRSALKALRFARRQGRYAIFSRALHASFFEGEGRRPIIRLRLPPSQDLPPHHFDDGHEDAGIGRHGRPFRGHGEQAALFHHFTTQAICPRIYITLGAFDFGEEPPRQRGI